MSKLHLFEWETNTTLSTYWPFFFFFAFLAGNCVLGIMQVFLPSATGPKFWKKLTFALNTYVRRSFDDHWFGKQPGTSYEAGSLLGMEPSWAIFVNSLWIAVHGRRVGIEVLNFMNRIE